MPNIILKDKSGNEQIYNDVDILVVSTRDGGTQQYVVPPTISMSVNVDGTELWEGTDDIPSSVVTKEGTNENPEFNIALSGIIPTPTQFSDTTSTEQGRLKHLVEMTGLYYDNHSQKWVSGTVPLMEIFDGKDGQDGNDGTNGQDGQDGQDGYSPSASVSKSGTTSTIIITDKVGTTTVQVEDGQDYVLTSQDKEDIANLVYGLLTDAEGVHY